MPFAFCSLAVEKNNNNQNKTVKYNSMVLSFM